MALALYRSYRPGTLDEVVGQPHVVGPLSRALENGRVHHAYLFSGPRGCGKTSTARILARCLNCEQGPTATPCGSCRSCVELAPNGPGSIDVVELDAATHGLVEDARELRDKAVYAPAVSRYKIYIIDEAHQLSQGAANALLKLIEEPPEHLRFVFATTEPEKIIPTIRSRTFHYGFRLVPAADLAGHLGAVCLAEGIAAEPAALAAVARAGAGSVRDSLSVLGQLLAGVGESGLTYADTMAALGMTDSALLDDFVVALAASDAAAMFAVVDRVVGAGHDPRRFVSDVLDRLRDLVVLRADPEAVAHGLVAVPDDMAAVLGAQAAHLSPAELARAGDLVSQGLTQVKGATAPRLQLELLCARLALPAVDASNVGLLARLSSLERTVARIAAPAQPSRGQGEPEAPQRAAAVEPGPSPAPGAGIPAGEVSAPAQVAAERQPSAAPPRSAGQPASDGRSAASPPVRPRGSGRAQPDPQLRPAPSGAALRPTPARADIPRPTGKVPHDAPAARPARPPATGRGAASSDEATLALVRARWADVLGALRDDSRVAWMGFESGVPLSVSQGTLAVAVADAGRITFLTRAGHDQRLRQAVLGVLALDLAVDVVLDPGAPRVPDPGRGNQAARGAEPPAPESDAVVRSTTSGGSGADAVRQAQPGPGAPAHPAGQRPADAERVVQERPAVGQPEWDDPSVDDPDLAGGQGVELIMRELGARKIAETDGH